MLILFFIKQQRAIREQIQTAVCDIIWYCLYAFFKRHFIKTIKRYTN